MTQIVHSLRTGGSLDFGEITEVVPWDILAHDCGQDLAAPQAVLNKPDVSCVSTHALSRFCLLINLHIGASCPFHPSYHHLHLVDAVPSPQKQTCSLCM